MPDPKGKVALVTGSSRGIGRAIALKLAENGTNLIVNYFRHREQAEDTAAAIRAKGVLCLVAKANVSNDEDIGRLFEEIKTEFGRLDILVSNAASGVLKPTLELTQKHWQWTMDINARALLSLVQHAAPLMKDGGRVIAVSSLGANAGHTKLRGRRGVQGGPRITGASFGHRARPEGDQCERGFRGRGGYRGLEALSESPVHIGEH